MGDGRETIRVRCRAGYRGEETPRSLVLGGREIEVDEVLDRWAEPGIRGFRVRTGAGDFLVKQEVEEDEWRVERALRSDRRR